MSEPSTKLLGRTATIGTLLLLGLLSVQALRLSLDKSYGIDEFDYSQAAWLVARGEVPYRDFFEHHFPLLYQALAPVFLVTGDDPTAIRWLRLACVPVWLAALFLLWRLAARRDGPRVGAWAPILALSTPPFVLFAVEIRPDPLALGLLLAALVSVPDRPGPAKGRSFTSGVVLALSMWASQKTLPLGALVGLAFLGRILFDRRHGRPAAGSPLWFLAGGFLVAGAVGLWLTWTDSWVEFVRWTFYWPMEHEAVGRRFSPWQHLGPWLRSGWWLWLLGGFGIASASWETIRRRAARGDGLLLVLTLAAFASYWIQTAPYPYSLVTFAAFLALWGERGLAAVLHHARRLSPTHPRRSRALIAVLGAVLAFGLVSSALAIERRRRQTNDYQHEVLGQIARLTRPDDPVYANSGSAVARPPTSYYYFTNAHLRLTLADELTEEIPRRIRETGTVAWIFDARTPTLPEALRAFLETHFVPYNTDLWLWGARFEPRDPSASPESFFAVRSGRYFVEPSSALDEGWLEIDGETVTSPDLTLYAGPHRLRYRGSEPLFLLWLPADGERYSPGLTGPPRFSEVF